MGNIKELANITTIEFKNGDWIVHPAHKFIKHWKFKKGEVYEVLLAFAIASLAEEHRMNRKDIGPLFNFVMRIVKGKTKERRSSEWVKS